VSPPAFSEHLMRDFGGATLGLALVLGAAGIWLERRLAVVALCLPADAPGPLVSPRPPARR
jgi:hypothetical protein